MYIGKIYSCKYFIISWFLVVYRNCIYLCKSLRFEAMVKINVSIFAFFSANWIDYSSKLQMRSIGLKMPFLLFLFLPYSTKHVLQDHGFFDAFFVAPLYLINIASLSYWKKPYLCRPWRRRTTISKTSSQRVSIRCSISSSRFLTADASLVPLPHSQTPMAGAS